MQVDVAERRDSAELHGDHHRIAILEQLRGDSTASDMWSQINQNLLPRFNEVDIGERRGSAELHGDHHRVQLPSTESTQF